MGSGKWGHHRKMPEGVKIMKQGNAAEDQDTVDEFSEMDDAALDAALDEARKNSENDDADDDVVEPEKDEKEEPEPEPEKDEDAEPEPEPEKDEDVEPEPEKEEPVDDDKTEIARLKEELAASKEQVAEKEKFAQLKANAEGELRKRLEAHEKPALTKAEQNAAFDADPSGETQRMIDEARADERGKIQEENNLESARTELVRRTVTKSAPDFMGMIDEIAELAAKDGFEPAAVAEFKADPFKDADHDILVGYAKQVVLQRKLEASTKRIEELETSPDDVAEKIEKAAKTKPVLKGKKPSSHRAEGELSHEQISKMSDTELEEMLAKKKAS